MSDTPDTTPDGGMHTIEGLIESLRQCVKQCGHLERKVTSMGTVAAANEQVMAAQRDRVKALEATVTSLKAQLREAGREL